MFSSIKFNPKSLSIQAQANQSNGFAQTETDLSVVLSIIALLISFKIVGLLSISWIVAVSASAALLVVPFIVAFLRVNKTIHSYKTK